MQDQRPSFESRPPLGDTPDVAARLGAVFGYAQVGRCLNGITHDINNALGAIMAYAELIMNDRRIDAESQRMLGEIIEGAKKCGALIAGCVEIARKGKPAIAEVDPLDIVHRVLQLRRHEMRLARIGLETRFEQPLTVIVADRARIHLALLCLIMNAQEALVEWPEDRLIRISVRPSDNGIAISIWNSSPPPPPELAARMFEPYVTTKGTEHPGLGLYIAREIAEAHGGDLVYAPDTGFTLRLPAKSPLYPQGCGPSM